MNKTIVAYDRSGSTSGARIYHAKTQEIVNGLHEANTRVVLWNTRLKESSLAELKRINTQRYGDGGTQSSWIAKALVQEHQNHCKLIVISDGEVGSYEVDNTEVEMNQVPRERLAEIEVHLIGNSVNMSVSCAFTRHAPSKVFVYSGDGSLDEENSTFVNQEDLDILNKLDTLRSIDDIETRFPAIERAVIARVMGTTGDCKLGDALIAMRKRVVADRSKQTAALPSAQALTQHVRAGDMESALRAVQRINADYFTPQYVDMSLEARISKLVNACKGSLRTVFTMQGVRGTKLARAATQQETNLSDVAITASQGEFTCPITLDQETDAAVLFTYGDEFGSNDVLGNIDAGIVDQCIQCPLAALRFPQVVEALASRIDHAVSLKSMQESIRAGVPFHRISPFTRRLVVGGLCLGASQDQAKATDWTLARALTREAKIVGNPDLWFAVIWQILESQWDTRFHWLGDNVRNQVRQHMLFRLKCRTSFASLIGLTHVVTTRLPLDVAVWFTLASAASYADAGFGVPAASDPLRAHLYHNEQLVKLCELANLRLPAGCIEHANRLKTLLHMLSWTKRDEATLRELVRSLYQNALPLDVTRVTSAVANREKQVPKQYVFVDGSPNSIVVQRSLKQFPPFYTASNTVGDLIALAKMVDPSKSAVEVSLPYNSVSVAPPAPVREWSRDSIVTDFSVALCPATLRPWYNLKNGMTWKEAALKRYGDAQLLSTYKWFEDYVFKYDAFPESVESFLVFMYNRLCICVSTHTTMPETSWEQAEQTLNDYAAAGCGIKYDVAAYKAVVKKSRAIPSRIAIETDYLMG